MSGHCLLKICKDKRHELSSCTISIGRKQTVKRITWPTIHDIPFFYTITTNIIHFQTELNKVCEELNLKKGEQPAKRNTRNQKQFEKLIIMQHGEVKLTVGLQRSNQDLVQYCITVPQQQQLHVNNKATTEK